MFGFGEKDSENTQDNVSSSAWGSQLSSAVADLRKAGMGSKGRAKADGKGHESEKSGSGISAKDADKLSKMFQPEKWKPLVRAPFNLLKAKTGRKCWELDEKETDTLAETTSATAEHFLHVDPKYMILTLFVFNWGLIVADKVSQNAREAAKEERERPLPPGTMPVILRSEK